MRITWISVGFVLAVAVVSLSPLKHTYWIWLVYGSWAVVLLFDVAYAVYLRGRAEEQRRR